MHGVTNEPPARRAGTDAHRPCADEIFHRLAKRTSKSVGKSWAFAVALGVIVVWALSGPIFHYSDTWQLVVNTGTTVVTFLMVFLIQNTQNRDSHELHLKLDELIRANTHARNRLIRLDLLTDQELDTLEADFDRLAALRHRRRSRPPAASVPSGPSVHQDVPPSSSTSGGTTSSRTM